MARGGDIRDMREFLIELEESAKAGDLARNERSLETLRRPELKAFVEVLKLKGIKSYAPKREFYVAVVDALVDQGLVSEEFADLVEAETAERVQTGTEEKKARARV